MDASRIVIKFGFETKENSGHADEAVLDTPQCCSRLSSVPSLHSRTKLKTENR